MERLRALRPDVTPVGMCTVCNSRGHVYSMCRALSGTI